MNWIIPWHFLWNITSHEYKLEFENLLSSCISLYTITCQCLWAMPFLNNLVSISGNGSGRSHVHALAWNHSPVTGSTWPDGKIKNFWNPRKVCRSPWKVCQVEIRTFERTGQLLIHSHTIELRRNTIYSICLHSFTILKKFA